MFFLYQFLDFPHFFKGPSINDSFYGSWHPSFSFKGPLEMILSWDSIFSHAFKTPLGMIFSMALDFFSLYFKYPLKMIILWVSILSFAFKAPVEMIFSMALDFSHFL